MAFRPEEQTLLTEVHTVFGERPAWVAHCFEGCCPRLCDHFVSKLLAQKRRKLMEWEKAAGILEMRCVRVKEWIARVRRKRVGMVSERQHTLRTTHFLGILLAHHQVEWMGLFGEQLFSQIANISL